METKRKRKNKPGGGRPKLPLGTKSRRFRIPVFNSQEQESEMIRKINEYIKQFNK